MARQLRVTASDMERLKGLLSSPKLDPASRRLLADELEEADVVASDKVPHDVVTMRSHVRVRDLRSDEVMTFSIVYPFEADTRQNKISILAPLGAAMLGYGVGDTVEWPVPAGTRLLRIEEVLYQPEAQGRFDL